MNNKIIMATIAAGLGCLFASAQPKIWQQPDSISISRELPRSLALPFDTQEGALAMNGPSKYLQTLDAKWERSENADAVTFKTKYKRPFAWLDRLLFIYIEGVTSAYEVRVNGKMVGYNQSSRTPAEFDITKESVEGNNSVEIVVYRNSVAGKISTSSTQPNILGKVYVMSPPKVRIRDWDISSKVDGRTARVELGVTLKSHLLNVRGVRLYYQLLSPEGELVTEGHRDAKLDMKREDTIRFYVEVPNVRLWSHESPNLYTFLFRTQHEGRFTEYIRVKTGVRDFVVKDNGELMLNGCPLQLAVKEVDMIPMEETAMRELLAGLKKEGYNAIRVKDAPQRRAFYDLCDQLGVYVCDQADINTSASGQSIKVGANPSNDPIWEKSFVDRVKSMYYTSQNHPSVIMFSLGENSANGYNLYESYLALKGLEKIRPVVYIGAKGEWNSDAVAQVNSGADRHGRVVLYNEPIVKAPEKMVTIKEISGSNGRFSVTNHCKMTPLPLQIRFVVKKGRKILSEGVRDVVTTPEGTTEFEIPYGDVEKGSAITLELYAQRPVQLTTDYYWTAPVEESKKFNPIQKIKDRLDIETPVAPKPVEVLDSKVFTVTVR